MPHTEKRIVSAGRVDPSSPGDAPRCNSRTIPLIPTSSERSLELSFFDPARRGIKICRICHIFYGFAKEEIHLPLLTTEKGCICVKFKCTYYILCIYYIYIVLLQNGLLPLYSKLRSREAPFLALDPAELQNLGSDRQLQIFFSAIAMRSKL